MERRDRELAQGTDVQEIEELKRQGMSIAAIASTLRYDRKTARKCLLKGPATPRYESWRWQVDKLGVQKFWISQDETKNLAHRQVRQVQAEEMGGHVSVGAAA